MLINASSTLLSHSEGGSPSHPHYFLLEPNFNLIKIKSLIVVICYVGNNEVPIIVYCNSIVHINFTLS